jgi:hypothetical protein
MSGKNPYSPEAWAELLDEVGPDADNLTQEQVQQELRAAGVDAASVLRRVKSTIQRHVDREVLGQAAQKREEILASKPRLLDLARKNRAALLDAIRDLISPQTAQVYANRLEQAATDADLKSLLEDLEQAKALGNDVKDGHGEAEI